MSCWPWPPPWQGPAVSFAGLLGFVGLLVPHIMRRAVGEDSLPLLLACALGGASLLTLCDLLSRFCSPPMSSPWALSSPWRAGHSSSGCSCGREGADLLIQLEHISAGYGGPLVVQDVSLDLTPGEVLVLLGPNGCGKSTC